MAQRENEMRPEEVVAFLTERTECLKGREGRSLLLGQCGR